MFILSILFILLGSVDIFVIPAKAGIQCLSTGITV